MDKKLVFFGGTFDPPHAGHVEAADACIRELSPDKIIVMPDFIPPHKKTFFAASPERRLEMCKIAFSGKKGVSVSDEEIKSGEKSYSYITIKKLAERYKDYKIYFLMGTDMLASFGEWKNPEEILRFSEPLLVVRGGEGQTAEETIAEFKKKFSSPVTALGFCGKDISSTEYKFRLMLGLDTDGFLTEETDAYIKREEIYKADEKFVYVRENLKQTRVEHTLGVMLLAIKYAKRLGVDTEKAMTAALLHDCAKYSRPEDFGTTFDGVPEPVAHQYLGAYVAENVLGVKDEEILNAIRYHTSGRPGMTLLEKIIYTADVLERGRNFDGVEYLRKTTDEDFETGFLTVLSWCFAHVSKSKKQVYGLTEKAVEYYKIKEKI